MPCGCPLRCVMKDAILSRSMSVWVKVPEFPTPSWRVEAGSNLLWRLALIRLLGQKNSVVGFTDAYNTVCR